MAAVLVVWLFFGFSDDRPFRGFGVFSMGAVLAVSLCRLAQEQEGRRRGDVGARERGQLAFACLSRSPS